MEKWCNKVAVVTGASSGMGAEVCLQLAMCGVICIGLSRRPKLVEKLNDRLEEHENVVAGGAIYGRYCDIRDGDSVQTVFDSIYKEFKSVDILINAAGILYNCPILDDKSDTMAKLMNTIDTFIMGTVHVVRAAYKIMKEQDSYGHMVLVNSIAGHSVPNLADKTFLNVYSPSKYAITSMVEVLRQELNMLQNKKIKVSSISPGLTKTNIMKSTEIGGMVFNFVPHILPIDIAKAILYILSTPRNVLVQELMIRPVGEDA